MSATSAMRAPSRRPAPAESERPALYVVRGIAPARSTVPFLMVVVLILAGALAASMLLNASMATTAFRMQSAQAELNVVNDHIDTVRSQVQDASAADHLTQRATELGMVPAAAPGVVDLTSSSLSAGQAAVAK
ncbi:hypothetical protein [Actinomyces faecalis]|uniref:hypothetical protein n=1 Tax=Actinomyces faecalis TaxID=2722820 RepID=UPI001F199D3B|nr:hypothetical protein [Actinomyces faecalis]